MSVGAVEATASQPTAGKRPAPKAIRRSYSSPVASFLVLLMTVLWTLPTFGLLVTSLRPASQVTDSGWWTFFTHPQVTLDNYHTVLVEGGFGVSAGLMPFGQFQQLGLELVCCRVLG